METETLPVKVVVKLMVSGSGAMKLSRLAGLVKLIGPVDRLVRVVFGSGKEITSCASEMSCEANTGS